MSTIETMLAVVLDAPGPPEALTIRELPIPRPEEGWVLVEVATLRSKSSRCPSRRRVCRKVRPATSLSPIGPWPPQCEMALPSVPASTTPVGSTTSSTPWTSRQPRGTPFRSVRPPRERRARYSAA